MEVLSYIFFLLATIYLGLLILGVINPEAKIFYKLFRKTLSRKQLARILAPAFAISFVLIGVFAPPVEPQVRQVNIEKNQEVITETIKLEGEIKGKVEQLKINDEQVNLNGSKFNKEIALNPGENKIKLVAYAKDGDRVYEIKNETYSVYFDYEGMLYAEERKKEQRADDELKEKLAKIPHYETVRKQNMTDGFSAVVYMDAEAEDYLLANLVNDFKSKNTEKNISVMIFKKADKLAVERIFESSNVKDLVPYVRANYEKRENNEQFFLFPTGLEGDKLAVEI